MLARAVNIAQEIGVAGRIQTICADALENGLSPKSADLVFCINAMHWSKRWARWVWEAGRIAKDGGQMLLTCSTMAQRSGITPTASVREGG
ncbi:MAG: class I SAM-dependent methyltransferase [Candidatus Portnoybacteria bacterium]|nr:class I SAM-dependent methyltransferase [Candidatus Portnoybacteria bacterium]